MLKFCDCSDQYNYTGWIAGIDKTSGEVKAMFSTEAGRAAPPQDGTWNGGGGGAGSMSLNPEPPFTEYH